MQEKEKVLLKLFISTLYLSAFTFGGGYVIVSLLEKKFVEDYHWIDKKEMLDLVAIAQSAPGAIAINGAIVIGYKLAGIGGIAVAILGTAIPPFVIISILAVCYRVVRDNRVIALLLEGMQAGVAAVIADVSISMGSDILKERHLWQGVVMALAFVAVCVFQVPVVLVIFICLLIGAARVICQRIGGGK